MTVLQIIIYYIYNAAFFRWMGGDYQQAYLVHPSARLSGMCMIDDCCYVGHLNAMSRHMETQHADPPNKGEHYIDLEECPLYDVTTDVGIDGQAVKRAATAGGEPKENQVGGEKQKDADTTAKTATKPPKKRKAKSNKVGGLYKDEIEKAEKNAGGGKRVRIPVVQPNV